LIHIYIALQAAEAFSTLYNSKVSLNSGSFRYFPRLTMIFSSILSIFKSSISWSKFALPKTFNDAYHQSVTNLIPSLSLVFSVGLGYKIKHKPLNTFLIVTEGAFIYFKNSIYFLSNTFKASSDSLKIGRAIFNSASQSSLIALALSTAS